MELQILWYVLWGVLWAVYFVLDGFDFGAAMLREFRLARRDGQDCCAEVNRSRVERQ